MNDREHEESIVRDIRKNMFHLVTYAEQKPKHSIDDFPTFWENELFLRLVPPIEKEIENLKRNYGRLRANSNYAAGIAHMIYMNERVLAAIIACKSPLKRDCSLDDGPY